MKIEKKKVREMSQCFESISFLKEVTKTLVVQWLTYVTMKEALMIFIKLIMLISSFNGCCMNMYYSIIENSTIDIDSKQ